MRTYAAILVALLSTAPAAGATGFLVNLNGFGIGSNVFGGYGDTVDVGIGNQQCSDEDDVVDIGIGNMEGCGKNPYGEPGCAYGEDTPKEGPFYYDMEALRMWVLPDDYHPHGDRCSDDGDTVDVGVANSEGTAWYCGPNACYPGRHGDVEDGVDVGVLNSEGDDADDAADVGVANCEDIDTDDGFDAGVLNREDADDSGDTFDLSLNAETNDGPDRNGLNLWIWTGIGCDWSFHGPLR